MDYNDYNDKMFEWIVSRIYRDLIRARVSYASKTSPKGRQKEATILICRATKEALERFRKADTEILTIKHGEQIVSNARDAWHNHL